MHFYEIHEGDEEVGTAVLLAHETRIEPFEFFEIVKRARAFVLDSYEEDSLAEAIANELQRSGGFTHVTDNLLLASVNIDETEENTYLLTEQGDTRTLFTSREENGEPQDGEEERDS
ncbi:MAG: hypothetical protein ACRDF9_13130 [Candidatus Limnocylindria bacterium]